MIVDLTCASSVSKILHQCYTYVNLDKGKCTYSFLLYFSLLNQHIYKTYVTNYEITDSKH